MGALEGHKRKKIPLLSQEQRAHVKARLSWQNSSSDRGDVCEKTRAALAEKNEAKRLEKLVWACESERVIVPIAVEADPRIAGTHVDAKPGTVGIAGFLKINTPGGSALAIYSSVEQLRAARPDARPMPLGIKELAVAALEKTNGSMLLDEAGSRVLIPRMASESLAHGEHWLPPWGDEKLRAKLRELCGAKEDSSILDVRISYAGENNLSVELIVQANSDKFRVNADIARISGRIRRYKSFMGRSDNVVFTPIFAYPA